MLQTASGKGQRLKVIREVSASRTCCYETPSLSSSGRQIKVIKAVYTSAETF